MQSNSVVFLLSREINKQAYMKTINLLCADNKDLKDIKLKGFNPPKKSLHAP